MKNVTIGEIFGHAKGGEVGIEIEMEAVNELPVVASTHWTTVKEGSLRNGREYVSKVPLPLDTKTKHLENLFKKIEVYGSKVIKDSHRTSVHTHNNITPFTALQVWTSITAYYLVENILFSEYFGEERIGNLFCLRLKDADYLINDYVKDLKDYKPFSGFDPETHKYAALNVAPIREKGSLEIRGMKGLADAKSIDIFSSTSYLMFKKASEKWESPSALLDDYYHQGWKYIVSCLFEDPVKKILLNCRNGEDLMEENAIRLLGYAYLVPWLTYQKRVNETFLAKPKPKKNPYQILADEVAAEPRAIDWAQRVNQINWFGPELAAPKPRKPRAVKVANNPPVNDQF